MIKNFIKSFWPIIFIALIWFIFSSPFFLQNKVPFATTYLVNFFSPWNAYPGFAGPVKNNAMPDVISQIYPWKTFTIDSLKNGILPLWNPYSFSGTAHLANYQSAVLSPFNLMFFVLPFIDAWSILVLLQPLLAGIFMYLFLRSIDIKRIASLVGVLSFMFCGFITTWMGYATLGFAILFLPLSLFAIEKFYSTKEFKYLTILTITFPLSFFSGHFQISLYFSLFVFLYVFYKYFETKQKVLSLYIFLYSIFGLLLTLSQVIPSIEAYSQSLRSTIFQKTEAIPWGYVATFFSPDFLGNPVTRNDWFGHYAEWNGFVGTIGLLLSFYAVMQKNKKVWFFIFTAIFSILLSFQSPLIDLIVFLKVPVLSTSAASRIIVIYSFSIAVLASFGLDFLLSHLNKNKIRKIIYWIFAILVLLAALWLIIIFKLFIPLDKIVVAKQNLILPSFLSLVLISLVVMVLLFRNKINKIFIILSLLILILVSLDMLRFATKWQEFDSKNLAYPNVKVEQEFKKIAGVDRIFGNIGGEATIYFKLPSIEGYDAVYNKRYGEFISSAQNGNINEAARSLVSFPKYGSYSQNVLDLLGVKYFIHKIADGRSPWTFPFWNNPSNYSLMYDDGIYQIFQNLSASPRSFLATDYKVAKNPQEIIHSVFAENTNLKKTIVLEDDPKIKLNAKNKSATITDYQDNRVTINTKSDGNAILFLSDAYYPGWKVYVDGAPTNLYRADYAFRAVVVSKGNHKVVFVYAPASFKLGLSLGILGIILMILGFFLRGKFILFPKI